MKKLAALTLSLFLLTGTAYADSPKDSPKEADAQPAKPATPAKPAAKATEKTSAEISAQLEELRQAIAAQQEQLQLLKEELAKRDKQIEDAREAAASANAKASDANVKATEAVTTSTEVKTTTTALNNTVTSIAASNAAAANAAAINGSAALASGQTPDDKGPTSIRFKGVTITPGGFVEMATVDRTKATSADINTPFTSIPYNGNALSKLSEVNFSARQSRLSTLVEGRLASAKLQGYVETDFLGAGTTSNNRQSNSYVLRFRQFWGNATFDNGFSFTGGQMWSLATENKKGIVNRGEALPLQIDPQYVVGFTWQRAPSFRIVQNFGDKLALGFSIENPQTTVGGRGFSTFTSTSAIGVVTTSQNFFTDAPGAGGGLYNAFDPTGYSVNKTPDFIVKLAADPGYGHYEVFGIFSDFRNRVYPCAVVGTTAGNTPPPATPTVLSCAPSTSLTPSAAGAYNDSRFAGGLGASVNLPVKHFVDVGLKVVAGDGIGRFGSAQLADVTARPDGTLAPIRTLQYLARAEWHLSKKFDLYTYWGSEFGARAAYTGYESVKVTTTPAIPAVGGNPAYPAVTTTTISTSGIGGYGSPYANNTGCGTETLPGGTSVPGTGGTCAGDVRMISEGTLGFWHRIYSGEKGRIQWGVQYSYIYKLGWSGNNTSPTAATQPAGISPKAIDNMIFTSFRYYLP